MDNTEINARIQKLTLQRDNAQNECVILYGQLVVLAEKVKLLEEATKIEENGK